MLEKASCCQEYIGIFLISSSPAVTFLPEGVVIGFQNFAWASERRRKTRTTPPTLDFSLLYVIVNYDLMCTNFGYINHFSEFRYTWCGSDTRPKQLEIIFKIHQTVRKLSDLKYHFGGQCVPPPSAPWSA